MQEYVSNCCSAPMDTDFHLCPACFDGCGVEEVGEVDTNTEYGVIELTGDNSKLSIIL